MKKLRVSYTMLSAAENGKWDEVLDLVLKKERIPTESMVQGKTIHKEIEEHIIKHKSIS